MATHYITQSGAGAANGTTEANAWSAAAFNTGSNWAATPTAGKISPGDTVILNGNVTTALIFQGSGTSGNPITLLFATGATMSKAGWDGAIIDINNKSYLVVDGGTNGIIESTNNGSASGGYATQFGATGVSGTSLTTTTDITVRNLTIRNLYVRTDDTDDGSGFAVRMSALSSGTFSNILVEDCTFHDMEEGVSFGFRPIPTENLTVRRCTIYNIDDGISVASGTANSVCRNIFFHDNRIYDFANWDDSIDNSYHHDGIHLVTTGSGSYIENIRIYNNVIGSGFGTRATSGIYVSSGCTDALVFNNILIGDPNTPGNGLVTVKTWIGDTVGIYNNVFIGNGTSGSAIYLNGGDSAGGTVDIKNNIFTAITATNVSVSDRWTLTSNRNLGYQLRSGWEYSYSSTISGSLKTIPQWQELGFDADSVYNQDPLLTETYRLGAGSPAIGEGENLSAFFTTDADGNTRPASGAWDIGAYQYDSSPPPPPPAAPGRRRRGAKLLAFF
jgi:hypothetical protein